MSHKRVRSKKHLAEVRSRGCCVCGSPEADAHHLRVIGEQRGLGIKNSDLFTIPLCRKHHDELHSWGDEKLFLDMHGIDPVKMIQDVKGDKQ